MRMFDVQAITIEASYDEAFRYIADPLRLPEWTSAFKSVSERRARLETPGGKVDIELKVNHSLQHGVIDWVMTFPDGTMASAFSRLLLAGDRRCIFVFVLMPPPVPLEQLEGALEQQSQVLQAELKRLCEILGGSAH